MSNKTNYVSNKEEKLMNSANFNLARLKTEALSKKITKFQVCVCPL